MPHDFPTPKELENLNKLNDENKLLEELKTQSSSYLKHVWFNGIETENLNVLRCCIKVGMSVKTTTTTGKTSLHVAVSKNKLAVIQWLIAEGFSLEYKIKLANCNKTYSVINELDFIRSIFLSNDTLDRTIFQISKTNENHQAIDCILKFYTALTQNIQQQELSDNNNDKGKEICSSGTSLPTNKKVILLDVDDTIVNSNGVYNKGLISALKTMQSEHPDTKIILFTSYEWGENLIQKAQKGLTRLAVWEELKKQNLQIAAVVISGSSQYPRETDFLGSYYRDCFMEVERKILNTRDPKAINEILKTYNHDLTDKEYVNKNQDNRKIPKKADDGGNNNKEAMFRHVFSYFGKETQYFIFDDSTSATRAAQWLKENEGWLIEKYVTTVQANLSKIDTANTYCLALEKAFKLPSLIIQEENRQASNNNKSFSFLSMFHTKPADKQASESAMKQNKL